MYEPVDSGDSKSTGGMVDVGGKKDTERIAQARAHVEMGSNTRALITQMRIPKGNVYDAARIAGIMAAKNTPFIIPHCHVIPVHQVEISFRWIDDKPILEIESRVKGFAKTGVEMEALVAVSIAALTVYDMCKGVDKNMDITDVRLMFKSGGRSGTYVRKEK